MTDRPLERKNADLTRKALRMRRAFDEESAIKLLHRDRYLRTWQCLHWLAPLNQRACSGCM